MIELKNVSKAFKNNQVIDDVTIKFQNGIIYCIRGKNGCGKTVLLKLIASLMTPTSGEIVFDEKINEFGVIIESPNFWPDRTGFETLEYLSSFRKKITKSVIQKYLQIVGLNDVKNKKVRKYSLGMKQRLAIAQALMEEPSIILLDEPTNSLDDDGIEMLKRQLLLEKQKNKVIILVTHNIEDIESIVDEIYVLSNGKLS